MEKWEYFGIDWDLLLYKNGSTFLMITIIILQTLIWIVVLWIMILTMSTPKDLFCMMPYFCLFIYFNNRLSRWTFFLKYICFVTNASLLWNSSIGWQRFSNYYYFRLTLLITTLRHSKLYGIRMSFRGGL